MVYQPTFFATVFITPGANYLLHIVRKDYPCVTPLQLLVILLLKGFIIHKVFPVYTGIVQSIYLGLITVYVFCH
jgi:hypothetical protein